MEIQGLAVVKEPIYRMNSNVQLAPILPDVGTVKAHPCRILYGLEQPLREAWRRVDYCGGRVLFE
jgi:hypothetical protein